MHARGECLLNERSFLSKIFLYKIIIICHNASSKIVLDRYVNLIGFGMRVIVPGKVFFMEDA